MLISVGLLMLYADRLPSLKKHVGNVRLADAMTIGAAQALAVVPGTSRSGITITAGLFRGFSRTSAARFSFLLSTPAIGAAAAGAAYELYKAGGVPPDMRINFYVGILVSALTGCLVIGFFLRYLRRNTLKFFIYYRIIFGILVIALAFFRRQAG